MKNNRTTALLMLLVFLLVVAVVIIFLTGLDRNSSSGNPYENVTVTTQPEAPVETPEATPVPTTAPTSAPVYYPPTTAAPVHTATPVQGGGAGQAAIPAQAATPAPTPTPVTAIEDGGILPVQQLIPVVPGVNDGANTGDAGNTIPIGSPVSRLFTASRARPRTWHRLRRTSPSRAAPPIRREAEGSSPCRADS